MKNISDILYEEGEFQPDDFLNVSPAIHPSSNFFFKSVAKMRKSLTREEVHPFYTRGINPTVRMLCEKMAALENKDKALAFASGSAAIAAAVMNTLKKGDHAICVENPYSWTKVLFENYLPKYGVECTFVNGKDPQNFAKAIKKNTSLIYLESPNSFYFDMQDLEAIGRMAHKHGLKTILDNSYASPLYQSADKYGIDIILHSATKYISGHSDAVGGILCCSESDYQNIFKNEYMTLGAIMSPFNAWLMIRSLRTLEIRINKISESTKQIVSFLESHKKIKKVLCPGSATYEQPKLSEKYLKNMSGLFTLQLKTKDVNKVELFCDSLKKFKLAASWGSYESLIFPACVAYQGKIKDPKDQNMIRFAIGLESAEILIKDLKRALKKI